MASIITSTSKGLRDYVRENGITTDVYIPDDLDLIDTFYRSHLIVDHVHKTAEVKQLIYHKSQVDGRNLRE